ncbi:unnamed protein product [Rangifer tarandus platyrhynchus]|uniref:Uncharacterized protein n=2 Tax=Rangifer tarandus platyrhynchus TaxID=3082113 RepID=A0ABN8YQ18_RANTA|nr:unnamed protein product [Rangifer tarandus platyrhynchus]
MWRPLSQKCKMTRPQSGGCPERKMGQGSGSDPSCSSVMTRFQSKMQLIPKEQEEGADRPGIIPNECTKAGGSSMVRASQPPACPESGFTSPLSALPLPASFLLLLTWTIASCLNAPIRPADRGGASLRSLI